MTDFSVQQAITNKIIRGLSEKLFCELHPTRPRKPNGVAQRYNPDYRSDLDPKRGVTGAPTVVSRENGNTSIGDVESAVSHVVDGGSLSAVPDEFLGETIVRDIADGGGRFEVIADRTTPDGMLKFRDTSTGVVYGLKHHDGEDALEDAGRVEILASRVAEEFGFAQGRMRVASGVGENGSFAVLMEMPDSVVAGDTRDLVPAQSLSEADTDDVVRMVLMDFVLSNPSRSPLDIMGSSDDDGVSLHPVSHSGVLVAGVNLRDQEALADFLERASESNHPAVVELRRRLDDGRADEVAVSVTSLVAELSEQGNSVGVKRFMADTGRLPTSDYDTMRGKQDSVTDRLITLRQADADEIVGLLRGDAARERAGVVVGNPGATPRVAAETQRLADVTDAERKSIVADIFKGYPHLNDLMENAGIGPDASDEEKLDWVIGHMEANLEETMRRGSMVDADGNLTDDARLTQVWYDAANRLANNTADKHGVRVETAAAAMAVLSAGTSWERNVPSAINAVRVFKEDPPMADVAERMFASAAATKANSLMAAQKRLRELKQKKSRAKKHLASVKTAQARVDRLTEELSVFNTTTAAEWVESMGGNMAGRISDQPDIVLGKVLKASESFGLDGDVIREVGMSPNADGSFSFVLKKAKGATSHAANAENDPWTKVARILKADKENPDLGTREFVQQFITDNLSTQSKVRSFYNNIVDPNDTRFKSLTADTHHFNASLLMLIGSNDEIMKTSFKPKPGSGGFNGNYWAAREAAIRIAEKYGLNPREVQSIVWEAQRRLWNYPSDYSRRKAKVMEGLREAMDRIPKTEQTEEWYRRTLWNLYEEVYAGAKVPDVALFDGNPGDFLVDLDK